MILYIGDVHGRFHLLNSLIEKFISTHGKPSQIIQVGDLGYGFPTDPCYVPRDKTIPFYFIDGNHDNHDKLKKYRTQNSVHHIKRGTLQTLENQRVVFCGGGTSIDRIYRIEGVSYWRDEVITAKDIEKCLLHKTADLIVTHECPKDFFEYLELPFFIEDPSCEGDRSLLNVLKEELKPSTWIFGHYHEKHENTVDNTKFYCLPDITTRVVLKYVEGKYEWVDLMDYVVETRYYSAGEFSTPSKSVYSVEEK